MRLIASVQALLTPRLVALPVVTTLFMWLAVYAGVYFFGGRLLGIDLTYPEALMVLSSRHFGTDAARQHRRDWERITRPWFRRS